METIIMKNKNKICNENGNNANDDDIVIFGDKGGEVYFCSECK